MFFGLNALFLMAGSFSCMKLAKKFNDMMLIRIGFAGVLAGGLLLMAMPGSQVLFFTLPMCLVSFGFGLTRPLSINLILETVDQDAGSASSLMMFANFVFGAGAMWIISLGGEWKIAIIRFMAVLSGLVTLFFLWFMLRRKSSAEEKTGP